MRSVRSGNYLFKNKGVNLNLKKYIHVQVISIVKDLIQIRAETETAYDAPGRVQK